MTIKIIIIIFALFALWRAFFRHTRSEISQREFFLWVIFWALVIAATLWHKTTDIIAKFLGVSRGADLLVYVSVIVLFFIVFKLFVKIEKIEREITKVVRKVALDEKEQMSKEENQKM